MSYKIEQWLNCNINTIIIIDWRYSCCQHAYYERMSMQQQQQPRRSIPRTSSWRNAPPWLMFSGDGAAIDTDFGERLTMAAIRSNWCRSSIFVIRRFRCKWFTNHVNRQTIASSHICCDRIFRRHVASPRPYVFSSNWCRKQLLKTRATIALAKLNVPPIRCRTSI